jgi:ribosomal protein S18 acetylase RimI-like enzyme
MTFTPFQPEHIPAAAGLLAEQFQSFRHSFPLLPARMKEALVTQKFLEFQLQKNNASGAAYLQNGKLAAFIIGNYSDNIFFGPHVWVPLGGAALAPQLPLDLLARLYSLAGQNWIREGILNHYLVSPALPEWLSLFQLLSFGQEQAYAVASLSEKLPGAPTPPGILIRKAEKQDEQALYDNAHWIAQHLNGAPVWEPVPQAHLDNIRPGYAELATDESAETWLAFDGDKMIAVVAIYAEDIGAEHLWGTSTAAHFAAAATHPDYRARGIGRALFSHAINISRTAGFESMFTDWRTTNLEARRYWPEFGFQPFAYRLIRRVNPRYAPFEPA